MGSLEEGSPGKENSPKQTPKQPQAHLGVELRDVGSSLREVEKLGGKGRGCEKAGPFSLSLSLRLPCWKFYYMNTHEAPPKTHTDRREPTTGSQDEQGDRDRYIDTQPCPWMSRHPELKVRRGWNLSWAPRATPKVGVSPHCMKIQWWQLISIWPSLVSTSHGAFRNSPHGNATALWSDTLYQRVQTMLGGPSQILDLPGDTP